MSALLAVVQKLEVIEQKIDDIPLTVRETQFQDVRMTVSKHCARRVSPSLKQSRQTAQLNQQIDCRDSGEAKIFESATLQDFIFEFEKLALAFAQLVRDFQDLQIRMQPSLTHKVLCTHKSLDYSSASLP